MCSSHCNIFHKIKGVNILYFQTHILDKPIPFPHPPPPPPPPAWVVSGNIKQTSCKDQSWIGLQILSNTCCFQCSLHIGLHVCIICIIFGGRCKVTTPEEMFRYLVPPIDVDALLPFQAPSSLQKISNGTLTQWECDTSVIPVIKFSITKCCVSLWSTRANGTPIVQKLELNYLVVT